MTATASVAAASVEDFLVQHPIGSEFLGGFIAGYHPVDRNAVLIVSPKSTEVRLDWQSAVAHCAGLEIGGAKDWRLPDRMEALLMWKTLSHHYAQSDAFKEGASEAFERRYYWTGEEYEFNPGLAWRQLFDVGFQFDVVKVYGHFVRAVRKHLI